MEKGILNTAPLSFCAVHSRISYLLYVLDEMAHGVKGHYTAVLGSKSDFTPALWALAVQHELPTARERAVIGDGAAWVWNVAEDVCPDGRQIVDWFHAVQHLAEAANALYPDDKHSHQRQRWLKIHKDHLYRGRIHKIMAALCKRERDDLAAYFENHQRRMQYLEFREERFPIGSDLIESGVKQFKQRLTGAGMRWNADHAQRMLVIRAAVLSLTFMIYGLWRLNCPQLEMHPPEKELSFAFRSVSRALNTCCAATRKHHLNSIQVHCV